MKNLLAVWQWITDETWSYTNWNPREPNNRYGGEHGVHPAGWPQNHLMFYPDGGTFDDMTGDVPINGYIVEYETKPDSLIWTFDNGIEGWTLGGTYTNPASPYPRHEKPWGDNLTSGGIVLDACGSQYDEISKEVLIPSTPSKIEISLAKMTEPDGHVHNGLFQLLIGEDQIGTPFYMSSGNEATVPFTIPTKFLGTKSVVKLRSISNGDCNGEHIGIDEVSMTSSPITPSITLTSPNGGESWQPGGDVTITWTYTGDPGSNVMIELFNGMYLDSTITGITSIGDSGIGSFRWTVPENQVLGSNYKVRITSKANPLVSDLSDNPFYVNIPKKNDLFIKTVEFKTEGSDKITVAQTDLYHILVDVTLFNKGYHFIPENKIKVFLQTENGDELIGERDIGRYNLIMSR